MTHTTRNASLSDLAELLQSTHARRVDLVAGTSQFRMTDGMLHVKGADAQLSEEGVTSADGVYRPTRVFDEGVSSKLGIPVQYLRRLREERPDLYDANVNGLLHGRKAKGLFGPGIGEWHETRPAVPADPRAFMLRLLAADDTEGGVARAMLSDSYRVIDNLDVLMASLEGIREAGVQADVVSADLTDRRMYVRVKAPQVQAYAPQLLAGYRSPFTGQYGADNPTVFAGFELSNSETGGGAFAITPRLIVQVCDNGMKMTKDVVRSVHLGGRLEEGVVRWSEETQRKSVELVKAKTADAVRTFLDVSYVQEAVARLEQRAQEPIESIDGVRNVTKPLSFSQSHMDGILDSFIKGGQMSRAGVVNAITAYSQSVEDADVAAELEEEATKLLVG